MHLHCGFFVHRKNVETMTPEWSVAPDDQSDILAWASQVVRARVPMVLEKLEQELLESVTCRACGKGTDEEVLLLCDACQMGYHTYCLTPPLAEVPAHNWLCPSCMDYENIDSSDDEAGEEEEEPQQDELPEQDGVDEHDTLFRHRFVNAAHLLCDSCRTREAARFVLEAAQAALPPRSVPPLSPKGRWLCEGCSWPAIEEAWQAQMKAAKEMQLESGPREPREKKQKRTRRFGPCGDMLFALAMEKTGALESNKVQWQTMGKEFFPFCTARQLQKRFNSLQRTARPTNVLVRLNALRTRLKRMREAEAEARGEAAAPDEEQEVEDGVDELDSAKKPALLTVSERVARVVRPLTEAEWSGVSCAGCGQQVRGSLAWCDVCGLSYCVKCHVTDPLGHALAHWSECGEQCRACGGAGVACNNEQDEDRRMVYCEACLACDAREAVAKQFLVKHKPVPPKQLRQLGSSLRLTPAALNAVIDRVRNAIQQNS